MNSDLEHRTLNQSKQRFSSTFIIVITLFVDAIGFGIIIPLIPFYAQTLQAGSAAIGVLIASFSIMQFFFSPMLGRFSDKVGRKPVLLISILASSISYLIFGFADSFLILLLSRIIAGIATETAVAQAYIADVTDHSNRTSGIGKVVAAHSAGFIIGPVIGGTLSVYGYWAPGIAAATLTLINFVFVAFFLPESNSRNRKDKQLDQRTSNRSTSKIIDAMKKPIIGSVLIIHFIVFLAFSAVPVIVPLLGIAFFGIGTLEMSYIFIYIGTIQIILQSVIIGKLTNMLGEEALIIIGTTLMTTGVLLMPLFANIAIFLGCITMIASGSGIMRTSVPSFLSKKTPVDEQGGILGIASSVLSIATVPGPLIGGFLFEIAGVAAPFLASSAILSIGIVFGFRVLGKHNSPKNAIKN
jgi:multidrug resistance protein